MFFTTPDGSTTPTERMRIDSNGLITGTGTSLGAWTAYTPTLGGTGWALGNGTSSGFYCQIGKIILWRAIMTFGSTSTFGSTELTVTIPITGKAGAGNTAEFPINTRYFDASTSKLYVAHSRYVNATTAGLWSFVADTTGEVTPVISTTPFTWATLDQIYVNGFYEAA
jgi:hypothetical protein